MKQIFIPKLDFNYVGVEISSNITMAMAKEQRRFVDQVAAYAGSCQGVYIVLEGADLTGKSSQCWNILKLLRDNTNLSIQLVEEPGGTPRADEIRRLVKDKSSHLSPMENVKLFTEARIELMREVIEPALARGEIVIAARNWWSTLAYQGYGQGVDLDEIINLTGRELSDRYVTPDAGAILLADDEARRRRRQNRDGATTHQNDAFEDNDDANFVTQVDEGYRQIAKRYNIPIVDASAGELEVLDGVLDAILCQLRCVNK